MSRTEWKRRWDDPVIREMLRPIHGTCAAYMATYSQSDEGITRLQELAMSDFVYLEKSLLRRHRRQAYLDAGKHALHNLAAALRSDCLTPEADVIFVAIDFEGRVDCRYGLQGFGFAKLDIRRYFSEAKDPVLECASFTCKSRCRDCLFGDTFRVDVPQIRQVMLDCLNEPDKRVSATPGWLPTSPRKVVLVGHGLGTELKVIEDMGLTLEDDLPMVHGIIDTSRLSYDLLGRGHGLGNLLKAYNITYDKQKLHVAGNDAYWTLQVLSKLLCTMHPDIPDLWDTVRARATWQPPIKVDKVDKEDWETHLQSSPEDSGEGF